MRLAIRAFLAWACSTPPALRKPLTMPVTSVFGTQAGRIPRFTRTRPGPILFTGAQQGQGGNYTGSLVDATTYASLIRIRSNGSGSSDSVAAVLWRRRALRFKAHRRPLINALTSTRPRLPAATPPSMNSPSCFTTRRATKSRSISIRLADACRSA